jgi:RNA polymerase sigma-54 factor
MNIRQQLNMRLSQNLVMTQSLQQAIKLLQLSKIELESLINQELEENPVLEEETSESEPTQKELRELQRESSTTEVDVEKSNIDEVDTDYFFEDYIEYQTRRSVREEYELPSFENTLAQPTSLIDHLQWQLNLSITDDKDREIGEAIIGNLNDDGYLRASNEEIAEMSGAAPEQVEAVRNIIMRFDPIGVASSGIQECLLVQLENLNGKDVELPKRIISDYLGHLEKRAYEELAKELKCDLERIQKALEVIRSLDPKPGSKYNDRGTIYVEPDVFILRDGDDYVILLNEENLPRLRLNQSYQKLLSRSSDTKQETKDYIRERMNSAKWLLKSFVQRQRTIYKVVESIVNRQREFLNKGVEYLKPMVLSDVALDISMHESTVSRVVTNKYVHTPRGVFELKYFFSTGIRSTSGDDVSSLAVKRRIKQIVESENSKKPLSDSKIMAVLNQEGLKIARRTVAKYREELHIPPSKLRKSVF